MIKKRGIYYIILIYILWYSLIYAIYLIFIFINKSDIVNFKTVIVIVEICCTYFRSHL